MCRSFDINCTVVYYNIYFIKIPCCACIGYFYKLCLWRYTVESRSMSKFWSYQVDISLQAVCWELLIWSSTVGLGEWLSAVGLQQSSRLFCCHSIPSSADLPLRDSPEKTGADLVHLCFSWCWKRLANPRVCRPCPLPVWSFNWDYILEQGQNVELAYTTFRNAPPLSHLMWY